jgi:hypothetical protein
VLKCIGLTLLEALYRTGSKWHVGCDCADWWCCYPTGGEHMIEEKEQQNPSEKQVVSIKADKRSLVTI